MKSRSTSVRITKLLALPALIVLSALPSAIAQEPTTSTWMGGESDDWNTGGNWDPAGVPSSGINAGIIGSFVTTSSNTAANLGQLLLSGSSTLELNHSMGITGVGGLGGFYAGGSGNIDIADGGALTVSGGVLWVGYGGGPGTLNVFSGGSLNSTGVEFRIGSDASGAVTLETGGSITTGTTINVGREGGGNGAFTQTGGILNHTGGDFLVGAFGATGVVGISNGTAAINSLRLNFAGSGTGTVEQSGGNVTLTGEPAIGWANSGNATYNLSGGTVVTNSRLRFGIGNGQRQNWFNQTGGDVTVNGRIDMGEDATATVPNAPDFINKYSISAGSLTTTDAILVGAFNNATGTLEVSGTANVKTTRIQVGGDNATSASSLNLIGGTVKFNFIHAGNNVTVPQIVNLDGTTLVPNENQGNLFFGGLMSINLGAGGVVIDSDGKDIGIPKAIGGIGKLTKKGAGSLVLQSASINTYEGGTTISGGLLQLLGNEQLGSAVVPSNLTFSGTGGGIKNNDSFLDLSANRTVVIDSGAKAYLVAGWGKSITVQGKITGGGDLVISNDGGPVILKNPSNDYTGKTVIGASPFGYPPSTSAVLKLGGNQVIGTTGMLVFDGGLNDSSVPVTGTFDMAGFNTSVSGLLQQTGLGIIRNTSGTGSTLTVGMNNTSSIFDGMITEGISIIKTGTGTLTLTGSNSYTGDTRVNAGILAVSGDSINDLNTLAINGGKVKVTDSAVSDEIVNFLYINGTPKAPGTYGGTGSGATTILPANFEPALAGRFLTVLNQGPAIGGGFSTWITGTFANGSVPASQQGPNDDPDKDGISNLLEYAVAAMDPTVGNGSVGTLAGKSLTINKRQPLASDITYAIEESASLVNGSWLTVTPDSNDTTSISYTLPAGPAKDFMRLRITQP